MKKMAQPFAALLATFFVIALITTFVLPDRPTPEVIKSFFGGLTDAVRATLGVAAPTNTSQSTTNFVGRMKN